MDIYDDTHDLFLVIKYNNTMLYRVWFHVEIEFTLIITNMTAKFVYQIITKISSPHETTHSIT